MREIERRELIRRAKAMSQDEQTVMLAHFDSKLIASEYYRRLAKREREREELQAVLNKYKEEDDV